MEKKQAPPSEEIDLLYFFRPISNGFKRLGAAITHYVRLLAHNRFLFAGILLLGSIAGYCLRFVIPPSYKTEGMFISDMLPARYCTGLVNNLNELRKPKNIPTLAQQLGISTNAAWQIRGLEATTPIKDTFTLERRDSSLSMFRISLVLADMNYVEEVQKGLKHYLENNELVRMRKEARKKNLLAQRAALTLKLQSLDSLRRLVNSSVVPRSQGQGIIFGEPIDPVPIYQAEMAYLRDQLNIDERLSTYDHIKVLQPFFKLNEHNNPNFDKLLNYAFIASFLFAMMVTPLIGRRLNR